jgi:hypothetical protein
VNSTCDRDDSRLLRSGQATCSPWHELALAQAPEPPGRQRAVAGDTMTLRAPASLLTSDPCRQMGWCARSCDLAPAEKPTKPQRGNL